MEKLKVKLYNLLRASEKYTKTDMVYLARGGFWLTLSQLVAMAAGLGLSIAFANLIPKESFGTYKFVLAATGIITAFSLTGLPSAVARSVAQGFEGALKKGYRANLKWSAAVFTGGLIGAIYYFLNDNLVLAVSLLAAGSLSPFIASGSLYIAFLQGKKDFRKKAIYSFFHNVTPALALFLTILLTKNPLIIILVYFLANSAVALWLYHRTLRAHQPTGREDLSTLSYGKHLSLMSVIGKIAAHIDKVLAWNFLGAAPLAIYSFAIAPVDQLQLGKKIMRSLALPKASARPFSELQKSTPRKALVIFLYALVVASAYIILAPFLYKLIFPQYLDSIFLSQLYALTLFSAPALVFLETLTAHKKTKELYIINTTVPLVQIGLFLILLPLLGLTGLIIALVFSKIFSVLISFFFVKRPLR